ncbi:hypothetical protein XYCOK13_42790 [Xylanibacillus composti]|uniref:Uncharacterized protein n=2 Tax=Xylanibacillus composti TaxID=1572762 RepID=A0A8J4H7R9_9BACL|nr:hypothetical protein XYCOK13_42790 [Xylanibacillus composti]
MKEHLGKVLIISLLFGFFNYQLRVVYELHSYIMFFQLVVWVLVFLCFPIRHWYYAIVMAVSGCIIFSVLQLIAYGAFVMAGFPLLDEVDPKSPSLFLAQAITDILTFGLCYVLYRYKIGFLFTALNVRTSPRQRIQFILVIIVLAALIQLIYNLVFSKQVHDAYFMFTFINLFIALLLLRYVYRREVEAYQGKR